MKDNPIFKVNAGWLLHPRGSKRAKEWSYRCPRCGQTASDISKFKGSSWNHWSTRKKAKDALHRHSKACRGREGVAILA